MSLEQLGKQTILLGPWGGQEGFHWDDGAHSTIRQLEIAHGLGIDSIRIEYDNHGRSIWSEKHGGSGGSKLDKVKLDHPDEYLTSVHGYHGSLQEGGTVTVRSLTFISNKRTYGPFGLEKGTYFTCPTMHGKIVGFLGKSGWYLDSIGLYVEPHQNPALVSNSIYRTQQYNVAHHGTETSYEYSMIQGSLGPHYDLIVAVRQKENDLKNSRPVSPHQEMINHPEKPKNEVAKLPAPQQPKNEIVKKIERVPSKDIKVLTYGPWGGDGGSLFDDGVYDGIRQINLSRNVGIVSIRVCYDKNGQPVWGSKNGGKGSFKKDKIVLDYPSEMLTHVTGYRGPTMIMGSVIKSLTFHTTKGKYGPYGEEQGEFFSTKLREGSIIVGFHGRKGLFIDAIGVHVLEGKEILPAKKQNAVVSSTSDGKQSASTSPATKTSNQTAQISVSTKTSNQTALSVPKSADNSQWPFKAGKRGQTEEVAQRLVKDPAPYGTGPWGGEGGKPWDDGVFTGIKQIILTITDAICCIEIEYDRSGQSVWSVKHGGSGGQTANRVKLDYPHEVLTCISGYYGPIKKDQGTKVIHSLTFHTSRRKYGPFGEELGTYFASGTTEGKVVGFHGRCSMYLDAIGVHMQHWLGNQKPKQSIMRRFS